MANISKEIIEWCILPKLPAKSLIRFKCVSKSWQTLISSSDFVRLHHRHALSTDANRLIIARYVPRVPNCFHIYDLDSLDNRPSLCPYSLPETSISRRPTVIASYEFFLLILIARNRETDVLILLNPSTRSYHEIPCQYLIPSHQSFVKYGICFDEANDDYKVIMITASYHGGSVNFEGRKVMIMIYSSSTNSWRLIEDKLISVGFYDGYNDDVFVIKNLLYMRLTAPLMYNEGLRIACFDIEAEQWTNDVPLPNDIDPLWNFNLSLLDGSICVAGLEKEKRGTYCVWVMKDYCWVKLTCGGEHYNFKNYYPIAYRTGSRHELLCVRNIKPGFYWFNTRDRGERWAEFYGYSIDDVRKSIKHVVKGSLLTFSNKLRRPKEDDEDVCSKRPRAELFMLKIADEK